MHLVHITRELLHAVADGRRQPGALADVALGHLFQVCPTCKAEFEAWRVECAEDGGAAGYGEAVERALAFAEKALEDVKLERRRAESTLRELLKLPAGERLPAIQKAPEEYRGAALAELLIDASLEEMPGRPNKALALAELAMAVLQHSDLSAVVVDLYARATAHVGNAVRVSGRLREAARLFDNARFLLRNEGGGDRLVRAELDRLQGMLCVDQRRFEEAEVLLGRAVLSYQAEGMQTLAVRSLLNLGLMYQERGDGWNAVEAAEKALALLDAAEEPKLCFYARHNRALGLCEMGRYDEAREALTTLQPQQGDPLSQLRFAWVEGKIARGLGELQKAESCFLVARHGFHKHEIGYDTALVSLELAGLYLEQRRTAEVKALAIEMAGIFAGQEVHREAEAALLLFRDAAELERVTRHLIRRLMTYLTQSRRDPRHPFELAS